MARHAQRDPPQYGHSGAVPQRHGPDGTADSFTYRLFLTYGHGAPCPKDESTAPIAMSTTTESATVTIHIPTPLRGYADDQATAQVQAQTAGTALRQLVERYPELEDNLYNKDGDLRQFVNIYVGDEDIRYLDGEETPLHDDAELSIVPSIAGGL